jgi:Protein of unknown function (DUF3168)
MVKTALWEVQKTVYSCLAGNAKLMGLITGVFDEVKEGIALPYVTIGDDTANPYDTKTTAGEEITITLHCWSLGPGKKEAKIIMDAVLQALTGSELTIDDNFKIEGIRREMLEVLEDGPGYHGICRFRFYIKQI